MDKVANYDDVFVAETRKRGEIYFYHAVWKPWPKARGGYVVKFLTGPHKDEKYEAIEVARRGGSNEKI